VNAQAIQCIGVCLAYLSLTALLLWIRHITFEHYELLHSRIAASVQRFGNKEEQLDKQQFGHAMFQLVDEWCRGASSTQMIVGWLRMLFSNIVDVYGNLKRVSDIGCIGKSDEVI
jgi:hypothetical protein